MLCGARVRVCLCRFIGLGIMGRGMALNLLKSGANMVVWNRTASKCDEFVEQGELVCSVRVRGRKCTCTCTAQLPTRRAGVRLLGTKVRVRRQCTVQAGCASHGC